MAKEVIIVGGGLSGISSAIWAIENGWRPIIFERSSQLGGRVASLYAKDSKNKIDIGQHVLSSNYKETKKLLSKIGSIDKVYFQKRLKINFKLMYIIHLSSWFSTKLTVFLMKKRRGLKENILMQSSSRQKKVSE